MKFFKLGFIGILIMALIFASISVAAYKGVLNEVTVKVAGTTYKVIIDQVKDPIVSKPFDTKNFFLVYLEKAAKYIPKNYINIWEAKPAKDNEGSMKIYVVEVKVIRVEKPVSGTLSPGAYDAYGPFSSTEHIFVDVTWTPTNQRLGIVLVDVEAGIGYGYWYEEGEAHASFDTFWYRTYYIVIIASQYNTEDLTYEGTITLYIV